MHHPPSKRDMAQRLGVLILAVLQLAAAGLVPVADAGLWDAGELSTTHVEAQSAEDCGTPHDHLFCQLCRTLAHSAVMGPGQPAPLLAVPFLSASGDMRGDAFARPSLCPGGAGPRAPPTA